jgi:ribulose-phosphate 3-epimerase
MCPSSDSYLIAASILSADMANLAEEVQKASLAGADWVHVDVMDGRYVPNITVGLPVVSALKSRTGLPLDVHLMIDEPERYVQAFIQAGADILTVQAEATRHLYRTLVSIRDEGARAGVALCPATGLGAIEHVLDVVDLVLIMTVEPGFGGQAFIPGMLDKVAGLAEWVRDRKLPVDIQVDGGINSDTIGSAARAGANVFVSGTGVFGKRDVAMAIQELRSNLPGT